MTDKVTTVMLRALQPGRPSSLLELSERLSKKTKTCDATGTLFKIPFSLDLFCNFKTVNCVPGARVRCGNKTEDQGRRRAAAASGVNIRLNNVINNSSTLLYWDIK